MTEQKETKSDRAEPSGARLTAQNRTIPKLKDDLFKSLPEVVRQLYEHKPTYSINDTTGSVTFYPSPHLSKDTYGSKVLQTEAFCESAQLQHFLSKVGCSGLESVYDWDAQIVKKKDAFNGFARAMEIAYFDHYPLRIKVSHIWLLIMQGLAAHVDVNAEKLRDKYVSHDGKKTLMASRPGGVKGSRKNEWGSVITEFATQIDENTVNEVAQLLKNDFSVTTDVEKVATQVTLMAVCKSYFNYVLCWGCGFRQITLDGTKQDWLNLKRKVESVLKDFVDQSWAAKWKAPLFDVLDRFIGAYDGEIDCLFWNSMVRRGRATSGQMIPNDDPSNQDSYYSGWINILFPYLNQTRRETGNPGGFWGAPSNKTEAVHNDDGVSAEAPVASRVPFHTLGQNTCNWGFADIHNDDGVSAEATVASAWNFASPKKTEAAPVALRVPFHTLGRNTWGFTEAVHNDDGVSAEATVASTWRFGGFASPNKSETIHNDDGKTIMEENKASQQCYDIVQHTRESQQVKDVLASVLGQSSSLNVFPVGLATAPVLYIDLLTNEEHKFKFVSGFIGVEQNKETLEVLPKVGWFIADE